MLLRRDGWRVNHKKVYRIYRGKNLAVRTKPGKKLASRQRVPLECATTPNQQWSMDFVMDRTEKGLPFRILTVIDNFTRGECLVCHADRSITDECVSQVLNRVAQTRGYPESIRVDNGSEFYSRAVDSWAYVHNVSLEFIRPGKPVENGYIESFNGRPRDECLNTELFFGLRDARQKLSRWMDDYNTIRPHQSLDNMTPREYLYLWELMEDTAYSPSGKTNTGEKKQKQKQAEFLRDECPV